MSDTANIFRPDAAPGEKISFDEEKAEMQRVRLSGLLGVMLGLLLVMVGFAGRAGALTNVVATVANGFTMNASAVSGTTITAAGEYQVEFLANCTSLTITGYNDNDANHFIYTSVDGGAEVQTVANSGGTYTLATGLAAGEHLFRIRWWNNGTGQLFTTGVTMGLTGGTEAVTSIGRFSFTTADANLYQSGWSYGGAYIFSQGYGGASREFAFTGSAVEVAYYNDSSGNHWAGYNVDGGPEQLAQVATTGISNGALFYAPLTKGLTPGTHTFRYIDQGTQNGGSTNTNVNQFHILNGTRLSSAVGAGVTSITVDSTTNIGANDWIQVDANPNKEVVKVSAVSGNVLTVTLTKAHAQYASVTGWKHPLGSISPYKKFSLSGGLIVAIGDSITAGADPLGIANYSSYVTYDSRNSHAYRLGQKLRWDVINLGYQGTTIAQRTAAVNDITTGLAGRTPSCVIVHIGTNDINGGMRTAAQIQSDFTALLTAIRTKVASPIPIYCQKLVTPISGGANVTLAAANTAEASAIAAFGDASVTQVDETTGMNLTDMTGAFDIYGLHPTASGQSKMAANMAAFVAPNVAAAYTLSGPSVGAISTSAAYTVSLPAGKTASYTFNITPAASIAGTFSPTSVQFTSADAAGASKTFTFTPSSFGSAIVTTTNDSAGGITDPAGVATAVSALTTTDINNIAAAILNNPSFKLQTSAAGVVASSVAGNVTGTTGDATAIAAIGTNVTTANTTLATVNTLAASTNARVLLALPGSAAGSAGGLPKLTAFGRNDVNLKTVTTPTGSNAADSTNNGDGTTTSTLGGLFAFPNATLGTSTYAGGNVTVGGYATNQDPATLVFGKTLETGSVPITFADFCRIVGAYAGGNSDGSSLYRALGDSTKTRITVSINPTTKARTITLTTTP